MGKKSRKRPSKSSATLEEKTRAAINSFSTMLSEILDACASEFTISIRIHYELDELQVSIINESITKKTTKVFWKIFDEKFLIFLEEIRDSMIANQENPSSSYFSNAQKALEKTMKEIKAVVSFLFERNNADFESYCRNAFYDMIKKEDSILRTLLRIKQTNHKVRFPEVLNLSNFEQVDKEIKEFKKKVKENDRIMRNRLRPHIEQEWISGLKQRLIAMKS